MATTQDPKKSSNLSFILNKANSVTYAERPIPSVESPHEVLLAINYTGICGSDVHFWHHGAIGSFVVREPMVLGHESSATVIDTGDHVTTLHPGDHVALEPGFPCRHCAPCLAGRYNLCPDMRFAATPPVDGTLTGFWTAPADFCHRLPRHVTLQEGALIEPLAVAVHIARQARIAPGLSVVIMGAGPIGLLCAAVAKAFGASSICNVDIVQDRIDFAKDYASTHVYLSQKELSAQENANKICELLGTPIGADVVIDATGAATAIQTCLHAVRMGGTYVQAGLGQTEMDRFPILEFCYKEVTARGSFRYAAGDYSLAVELVSTGKVDVKRLVSEVVDFGDAEEAFRKVAAGEVIKVLIRGPNEKTGGEEK